MLTYLRRKQMQPKLPELFTVLPDCPVTVEAIPSYQTGVATHYQTGTPDCKRPGRVSVGVSDYTHRSLINDEAIAYHEGDGFVVDEGAVGVVGYAYGDAAGAFAVGRAGLIVGGDAGLVGGDGFDGDGAVGQDGEELGKF